MQNSKFVHERLSYRLSSLEMKMIRLLYGLNSVWYLRLDDVFVNDGSIDLKDANHSAFEALLNFPMIKSNPLDFEGLEIGEKSLRRAKAWSSYYPERFNNGDG